MARNFYWKNEDYLCILTGKISNIIEQNTVYHSKDKNGEPVTRFKNVFSLQNDRINDPRLETCISWERQVIKIGDNVTVKGRYLEDAFLVKSLLIYRKVQNND